MTAAAWRELARADRAAKVRPLVDAATKGTAVPAGVVMGLIQQESDFSPWAKATDPRDVARGGSFGLMQMSLDTARALGYAGDPGDKEKLTGLFDPLTNIQLGVKYLADLLKETHGDVAKAVSGYNAGLSAQRHGDAKRVTNDPTAPLINQSYVDNVLNFAKSFGVGGGISVLLIAAVLVVAFLMLGPDA